MDPSFLTDRRAIALGTGLYAAGLLYGCWALFCRHRHSRNLSYAFVLLGWIAQTLGLFLRGRATHSCPLGNTFELLQFVVWSFSVLYLVVGPAFRLSVLGFFSAATAAIVSTVSLAVPAFDSALRIHYFGSNPWVAFHAALAVFSYGVLTLLALTSLMYLLQWRHLQRKELSGLFAVLPSIVELEHMSFRLLVVGMALLSVATAVGGVRHALDPASVQLPKLIVATAVWCAYAGVLVLRWRQRLVARPFALLCLLLLLPLLASLGFINASRRPLAPPPAPHAS